MGKRGLIVLVCKGKLIAMYNHWNSYPQHLGAVLVSQLQELFKKYSMEQIREIISNLKIIYSNTKIEPTDEEIKSLSKYADESVRSRKLTDWYVLLRNCQGSLLKTFESGYALSEEIYNLKDCSTDLFIEYVYILNFDDDTFKCNDLQVGSLSKIDDKWIS